MKYKIEDVFERLVKVESFEELDGYDRMLFEALIKYMHICLTRATGKHTTNVMTAWDELDNRERLILEEHFGRKNSVVVGLVTSVIGSIGAQGGINMVIGIMKKLDKLSRDQEEGR